MSNGQEYFKAVHGQLPSEEVVVLVEPVSRQAFIQQLKSWADANGLAFRSIHLDPVKQTLGVDIWNQEILISGENYDEVNRFRFGLYIHADASQQARSRAKTFRDTLMGIEGVRELP